MGCFLPPGSPGSWLALANGRHWGGNGGRGVEGEPRIFLSPQLYLRRCLWQQLHLFCGSSSYKSNPSSMVSACGWTTLWLQPLLEGFHFCIQVMGDASSPAVSVAVGVIIFLQVLFSGLPLHPIWLFNFYYCVTNYLY